MNCYEIAKNDVGDIKNGDSSEKPTFNETKAFFVVVYSLGLAVLDFSDICLKQFYVPAHFKDEVVVC